MPTVDQKDIKFRFTIEAEELKRALDMAASIVAASEDGQTIQITLHPTDNPLAPSNCLSVSAFNFTKNIRVVSRLTPIKINEIPTERSIGINGITLAAALSNLHGSIDIAANSRNNIYLKSSDKTIRLFGTDPEVLPTIQQAETVAIVTEGSFASALDLALSACESRSSQSMQFQPWRSSVAIILRDNSNKVHVIGCDSQKLAEVIVRQVGQVGQVEQTILIDASAARSILAGLDKQSVSEVVIGLDKTEYTILISQTGQTGQTGQTVIRGSIVQCKYPNTDMLWPPKDDSSVELMVNRAEYLSAIASMAVVKTRAGGVGIDKLIRIDHSWDGAGTLLLEANTDVGSVKATINAKGGETDFKITLQQQMLSAFLRNLKCSEIRMLVPEKRNLITLEPVAQDQSIQIRGLIASMM